MSVLIYSTSSCAWCKKAKEFFAANKVAFTDYNVGEDQNKADEMIQKSGQMGVPVIDIDGQIVIGFDEPKIKELLHL